MVINESVSKCISVNLYLTTIRESTVKLCLGVCIKLLSTLPANDFETRFLQTGVCVASKTENNRLGSVGCCSILPLSVDIDKAQCLLSFFTLSHILASLLITFWLHISTSYISDVMARGRSGAAVSCWSGGACSL